MEELIAKLKVMLREDATTFYSDSELELYLTNNGNDLDLTAYKLLIIKAEDNSLQISGMSVNDSSSYFLRLASMYRPRNTGTLGGG